MYILFGPCIALKRNCALVEAGYKLNYLRFMLLLARNLKLGGTGPAGWTEADVSIDCIG